MTDQQPAETETEAAVRGASRAAHGVPGGPADASDSGLPAEERKFRRDRRQKRIGGVCAGLGRHCDMDPVIFRIGLAVLALTSGLGLVFYGFAWLFVPYEDEEENEARRLLSGRVEGQALTAVLFALVGCGVFLTLLNNGGALTFAAVLALLLAGAGYWSQQRDTLDPDPVAAQAAADAPPEAKAPPVAGGPSWWRDPIIKDGTYDGISGYFWGPEGLKPEGLTVEYRVAGHRAGVYREAKEPRPAPAPRGPRWIGGWVFLTALLAGGLGTGLTWEDHPLGTSLQVGLACALGVFGLGIAVSAFLGRTGAGSIVLAVLTAGLLAASAALPKNITTHYTHTDWIPTAVADVRPRYEVGLGSGTLDLSKLDVGKGETLRTGAEIGAGSIDVILPKDATVRLDVEVGVGDITLPGDRDKDLDVAPGREKTVTLRPPSGGDGGGTIDLRLEVGVGQAKVIRATS
ncbi:MULTISPECIES: PspC domain-containing protein [Streptomyces]|uniref:Phage shock protein PspC N-terminal domain-containing protein n=1 Tax=Streptomyces venezuelae TaxID=54571 RepID=A0A5P2BEL1_STRVZ|nr:MULTISPECIES: PspC domain-containing protein [Streptomyces]NEA01541.1 PspC domain-containing protein [Streptomyces sp. SID10116]MYY80230.1 PspC domain-containing protein [Streptomyces sp. SID335]MYZ13078.1 PspC domain-containing protein [Streptomyces sp. SID337]NDZ91858.1 PspC domain-containing protein [Streptomyces sp. SID10115]NEB46481.1 PspC domain-containing protein [Streptomyces sp. SID339]